MVQDRIALVCFKATGGHEWRLCSPLEVGASHIFWSGSYGAEIPPIDDFGPAFVFEAEFGGEQMLASAFDRLHLVRPKKCGSHPAAKARVSSFSLNRSHALALRLGSAFRGLQLLPDQES